MSKPRIIFNGGCVRVVRVSPRRAVIEAHGRDALGREAWRCVGGVNTPTNCANPPVWTDNIQSFWTNRLMNALFARALRAPRRRSHRTKKGAKSE